MITERNSGDHRRREESNRKLSDIMEYKDYIYYSPRYKDEVYEYRHVTLPKQLARWVPQGKLLSEEEWRSLGVQQSAGWVHYMIHNPEPHILLFRREKDYQVKYPNGILPNKVESDNKDNNIV